MNSGILSLIQFIVNPVKEAMLANLFETACAKEGFNTGITWLDDRSDLYDKLRTEVRMGHLTGCLMPNPDLYTQGS